MKVTLVIPTLNEIKGAKVIMPRVKKEWVDEIIVIDGHSTDGTPEYFRSLGCKVITQKRPGTAGAWWEGFEAATGDVIILFSPEGNSIPEAIPKLIKKMNEGCDMVIASRYKDDAKSEDDDFFSKWGNLLFNKLINLLFCSHYTDTLVMYRAFKKELLTTLNYNENTGLGWLNRRKVGLFELLSSIRCAKLKLKTAEIPSDEPDRIGGSDSRAHPGLAKFRCAFVMLYNIIKEFIIWPFERGRSSKKQRS